MHFLRITEWIPGDPFSAGIMRIPWGIIDVAPEMTLWTMVTFILVLVLLYKFAWKPILSGLDKREDFLRESVANAEKLREEMENLEQTRQRTLSEVEEEAKNTLAKARKAANEAARVIEHKAREEGQIHLENARREIKTEREKAVARLKRESAETAVALAAKIIDEELDEDRSRALTDKLIKEL